MEEFKIAYKAEMQSKVSSMVQSGKTNGGIEVGKVPANIMNGKPASASSGRSPRMIRNPTVPAFSPNKTANTNSMQ